MPYFLLREISNFISDWQLEKLTINTLFKKLALHFKKIYSTIPAFRVTTGMGYVISPSVADRQQRKILHVCQLRLGGCKIRPLAEYAHYPMVVTTPNRFSSGRCFF
jgi:hypothetical protein